MYIPTTKDLLIGRCAYGKQIFLIFLIFLVVLFIMVDAAGQVVHRSMAHGGTAFRELYIFPVIDYLPTTPWRTARRNDLGSLAGNSWYQHSNAAGQIYYGQYTTRETTYSIPAGWEDAAGVGVPSFRPNLSVG